MSAVVIFKKNIKKSPQAIYSLWRRGGRGWIRTTEAEATDLQSAPFGHSGTLPYSINGAGGRTWTPDLLITNQLLYQLSYTSLNLIFCYRFKRLLHSNTRSSICQQDFLLFTNCSHSLFFCRNFAENEWSGRQDSNLRHLGPKPSTLPNWVTPRIQLNHYTAFRYRLSILNFKQISENIQRCFVYFGTNRAK